MSDVVSPEIRSKMMSGIKGKNTKPEVRVRQYLHGQGFRYSLHRRDLAGSPDLVLPKYHAAVFVHGCFWHAHPQCRYAATPSTRREFWTAKLAANRLRDESAVRQLAEQGWRVVVVWECALRRTPDDSLADLSAFLRSDRTYQEIAWNQVANIE